VVAMIIRLCSVKLGRLGGIGAKQGAATTIPDRRAEGGGCAVWFRESTAMSGRGDRFSSEKQKESAHVEQAVVHE